MTRYIRFQNPHNRRHMPARESMLQSLGMPQTFSLRDGSTVENRNGSLIDARTRGFVCGSTESREYLLKNGDLTKEQRQWVEEWGGAVFATAANTGMGMTGIKHKPTW